MMKRLGFWLRVSVMMLAGALVTSAHLNGAPAANESARWVDDLNRLTRHIASPPSPGALGAIEATSTGGRPEIRALRAALLYRADPTRWRAELAACFAIHDYAERARGKTNEISQEEFVARIKKVEASYPSLQPQAVMVVAFVESRDANLWFAQDGQHLSVARFLRGAFLAQVFKGTSLDAVVVANQLDQQARETYEKAGKRSGP